MPLPSPAPDLRSVAVVGALHVGAERGLAADLLAARALGLVAQPVCTALVMASHGRVTDVTDVPADTVVAAFEHLRAVAGEGGAEVGGMKVGVLGGHRTVEAVFDAADKMDGPLVLDVVLSGPSAETLLTERGTDALLARWGRADLVTVRLRDAELITGGEIRSLDDAQVAAQRAHKRGARRVLLRCGVLPARFFDAADSFYSNNGHAEAFATDLYYDGAAFALFEAPRLDVSESAGASSALALAALRALLDGRSVEEALQAAKRFVSEAIRRGMRADGPPRLDYEWERQA